MSTAGLMKKGSTSHSLVIEPSTWQQNNSSGPGKLGIKLREVADKLSIKVK